MFKFGLDSFVKKSLPQNFAQQILKLEMEIDINDQTQISQIQELISLYMIGVEYYESIKDKKYLFFKKKLDALILFAIQRENEEFLLSKEEIQNKRENFEKQSKRIEVDLIYSQTESTEAQVKGIVNNHTNHVKQIQSMIQNEIASQSNAFQVRLERRRKSKISHSQSQTEIDFQSFNSKLLIKQAQYKEQGSQTKQITQEEEETSPKNSIFQIDQKKIDQEQKQINKRHQRCGSEIPFQKLVIDQRFLSQESLQNYNKKHQQLFYRNH